MRIAKEGIGIQSQEWERRCSAGTTTREGETLFSRDDDEEVARKIRMSSRKHFLLSSSQSWGFSSQKMQNKNVVVVAKTFFGFFLSVYRTVISHLKCKIRMSCVAKSQSTAVGFLISNAKTNILISVCSSGSLSAAVHESDRISI